MQQCLSRHAEQRLGLGRALAALALACTLMVATDARADSATADALFREGRRAADAGDYATAAARFAESQRLDPAPGTLLNLSLAEEKLSRFASALDHARGALDGLAKGDARFALARTLRTRLETRAPRLRITLSPDAPAGTIVKRDNVELGAAALGLDLPLDPGLHTIEVSANDRATETFRVEAKEGARATIVVAPGPSTRRGEDDRPPSQPEFVPPPASAASAPSSTAPTSSHPPITTGESPRKSRAGLALLVGGGGALLASGVLGALVLGKKAVVEEHCPSKRCDAEGLAAGEAGRTLSLGSTVAFGVGAVATGVGVFLLVRKGDPDGRGSAALRFGAGNLALGGSF